MGAPALKAVGMSLASLAIGTIVALGLEFNSNYRENNNKIVRQGKEIRKTKVYSPLSYLELISENGIIKKVLQRSSLTDSETLRFKLNPQGKVEKMVEDSNLWGKANMRTSSPEENKTVDWFAVNQTVQTYINHFQEK